VRRGPKRATLPRNQAKTTDRRYRRPPRRVLTHASPRDGPQAPSAWSQQTTPPPGGGPVWRKETTQSRHEAPTPRYLRRPDRRPPRLHQCQPLLQGARALAFAPLRGGQRAPRLHPRPPRQPTVLPLQLLLPPLVTWHSTHRRAASRSLAQPRAARAATRARIAAAAAGAEGVARRGRDRHPHREWPAALVQGAPLQGHWQRVLWRSRALSSRLGHWQRVL
jgi:hypothetical protein